MTAQHPPTLPPLPSGWTENKAPSGHTYYYNAETKESTYRRPVATATIVPPPAPPAPAPPNARVALPNLPSHPRTLQQAPAGVHGPRLNLADPRVANAFIAAQNAQNNPQIHKLNDQQHDQRRDRPKPAPNDRPKAQLPIPGHEPWMLVYTKYGRRFVHNTDKKTSFWRIPEKLLPAIVEMDRQGIDLGKKLKPEPKVESQEAAGKVEDETGKVEEGVVVPISGDYDSEYEEVEVTDDESWEEGEDSRRKRQRREDHAGHEAMHDGPVEFGEDDIVFQLAAAEGYDDNAYSDDGEEENREGDDEDEGNGPALFRALLEDFKINPFSPWEKLIEEGLVFDDPRYTALPTMKARRSVWEEWSRERIRQKKEQDALRKEQDKKDPRLAYLSLLQTHASPKLYWPEFKRKFRKEAPLKDMSIPEKEKEKLYREYVARRKLPAATRKADLVTLLAGIEPGAEALPASVLLDMRYAAVESAVRDPLVEALLKSA